ncbi:MAG: citrate synthase [Phycisphaeraceae bacterium]|nr:citrate synthase [Phycisphaeraceae bacterium]
MSTAVEKRTARIELQDQTVELPVLVGSENEPGIDVSELRNKTGYITLDEGFGNTGSCMSSITFIDGEKGILRYRGYPIEQLAERSSFLEVAWLLIFGELPTKTQLARFEELVKQNALLHQDMRHHFEGFPASAHPMAVLSSMINACSCYHPELLETENLDENERFLLIVAKLLAKVTTIAAFSYKKSIGEPQRYPDPKMDYFRSFLHCMFSVPYDRYDPEQEVVDALDLFLMLHADHEQNCSTSTARMVGSSGANLFASMAAAVCALWGPLHGGANVACIRMLQKIYKEKLPLATIVEQVKNREFLLMGFGHRVYKNFDPRALILKRAADKLLDKLGIKDPLLDIAKQLEEVAIKDEFFLERKLYPNVDFYSGIILRAIGIPLDMFTVMFSIGRMPGWIANWKEQYDQPRKKIYRPRQIYTGQTQRDFVPVEQRG